MPHPHTFWHNYQHHHLHRRPFMICGPSRLVWFGIGSVATWAWIRHHENERLHGRGHGHGEWCPQRVDYPAQTQPQTQAQNASREWNPNPMMGHRDGQGQAQGATITTTGGAQGGAPQPQLPSPADQDYERLRQMGRNAEETISGMSEATIDSMMGALKSLKERLAERRGQQPFQEIEVRQQTNSTPVPSPEDSPRSSPRHWI